MPKTLDDSWCLKAWPSTVFPNDVQRARYLVRQHRQDLLNAGALARVGKDLVIFGARYRRWLQTKSADVAGYQIAPNRRGRSAA